MTFSTAIFADVDDGLCSILSRPCPKSAPITWDLSRDARDKWEISREALKFIRRLGGGNFGDVYEGFEFTLTASLRAYFWRAPMTHVEVILVQTRLYWLTQSDGLCYCVYNRNVILRNLGAQHLSQFQICYHSDSEFLNVSVIVHLSVQYPVSTVTCCKQILVLLILN